jgi:hypothetical protein
MKQSQIESELAKGKLSRETFRKKYTKVKITNVDITELQIVQWQNIIYRAELKASTNIFLYSWEALEESFGIPIVCWNTFPPNKTNMLLIINIIFEWSRPVYIYHKELLIVFCHLYFDLVIWVVIFNQQSTYLCQVISVILGSQQMCSQFFWKHSYIVEYKFSQNSYKCTWYDLNSLN